MANHSVNPKMSPKKRKRRRKKKKQEKSLLRRKLLIAVFKQTWTSCRATSRAFAIGIG
jgi:hypothetical protein